MARYIDADALGRWLNDERLTISGNRSKTETYDTLGMVMDMLDEMPTVDAVPVVHGEWKYYHKQRKAVCTVCSFERDTNADFGAAINCPNCGAKMDGGNPGEHNAS